MPREHRYRVPRREPLSCVRRGTAPLPCRVRRTLGSGDAALVVCRAGDPRRRDCGGSARRQVVGKESRSVPPRRARRGRPPGRCAGSVTDAARRAALRACRGRWGCRTRRVGRRGRSRPSARAEPPSGGRPAGCRGPTGPGSGRCAGCPPRGRVRGAARRLARAAPGWARLLVTPRPWALLRRSGSRPNSPKAILDRLYTRISWWERCRFRSSRWRAPRRVETLICEVTRARPARSSGRRPTRATWPRWWVPNYSSYPSAVVRRPGAALRRRC